MTIAPKARPIYRTHREGASEPWRIETAPELTGPWRLIAIAVDMEYATRIVAALSSLED